TWSELYQGQLAVSWVRARNRPDQADPIAYAPSIDWVDDSTDASDEDLFDEDPFDEDPFDEDPFGEDPFGTDDAQAEEIPIDYFAGDIPVDERWRDILTERSRSVSLTSELLRDTRDSRITPNRGSLLRMSGLVALELGANGTSVLDGEIELRHYARLSERVVAALAVHGTRTASLRSGRALPQLYWKLYGGEGSLRGVERDAVQAVGGGRIGLNVRSELRYRQGTFGLVAFWDRAQVWHQSEDLRLSDLVKPRGMVNGFGLGLRYTFGFPLRLDVALNDGFDRAQPVKFYFSIGQAF
ncbi:MAG: BamA/TamA family outer membrane protein, partial [Candidatus Latescibacterota bacterium]|nr:BamA/TamA family outer membrane protein [Candidatus Latescibacterota bacterium]